MKDIYYTTKDIKEIFQWRSDDTLAQRRKSGFLPEPDIYGRPNKWLKVKIDAIVGVDTNPRAVVGTTK
ncbi:hypothetical protein [Psychrobacter sp. DAB_AL32B]|uniref:hypothetical protein n=1 Tax=Psychrobacter sp. DAB_AL32B TaxID=1028414 RepID=UPI000B7CA10F|nr:hypothetical protein [Psychrobacter sp. DAB_AL32B]OXL24615.1 hypothetical protein CAN34_05535 [Psychrobacter sp. DAB_AL32B]